MEKCKSGFSYTHKNPRSGLGIKVYCLSYALQFTDLYIKALGKPSGNLSQPSPEREEEPA